MTLAEMIARLQAKEKAARARMAAALAASQADGVSDDDKAKHLAEFDAAEKDKDAAVADLSRAKKLDAAERFMAEPDRPGVTSSPFLPANLAPSGFAGIPARQRRAGVLKAFKGPKAEESAYQAGLFVAATFYGHRPSLDAYQSQFGEIQATLSTNSNGGAAYFVPEQIENSVIELSEQFGVFRRYADVVPMNTESAHEPRWTSGLTAYFIAQGSAPTASDPSWDRVSLVAKDLATFGKISRQLNEDALINLGDKWAMAAAVAFAEKEDDCGFNGTGASAYGGITGLLVKLALAANAASLYTATGHTTLGALTLDDFENVIGLLPEYPGIKPAWFCHKSVYHASMGRLKRTAGGVSTAEMTAGSPPEYGGYPVVFAQKMPKASAVTTGVTGILFGDMSMSSKFGDRRGRTFETGLDGNDFSQQLRSMLCTERFDINNHTVVDPRDTSNPGPMVALKLG